MNDPTFWSLAALRTICGPAVGLGCDDLGSGGRASWPCGCGFESIDAFDPERARWMLVRACPNHRPSIAAARAPVVA